ncbi:MAG: recombinase family protein [Firmicutes bacterium]|nr:recombinase family protein [Bacillota bacterium]
MANKVVKVIPAKQVDYVTTLPGVVKKKRVCAYARVSTSQDEQTNSYEAQVNYYTEHIKSNPEWEFAGIYSDEGITGTSISKRAGFQRMISDALAGKIDLILTKSVSRFARNTVDSLTTVRKLRDKGIEVYFEKENIYTLDSKGELLLTILSSISQQESVNISQNVAWGKRKSFADGKVSFAYSSFLGYDMGPDGKLYIVEEQAEIVRRIYNEYLLGYPVDYIRKRLTADGVPTPMGKKEWQSCVVRNILTNEKYIGDSILQKTFSVDVLTKKKKKNEGELPQYYIENNHPPIISREMFEMVREEMERRKENGQMVYVSHFSGRIQCGQCGHYYGRKVWHSNSPYRCFHWHCNNKFEGQVCSTPTIKEKAIEECFVKAFNELFQKKDEILDNYKKSIDIICDDSAYVSRKEELEIICESKAEVIKDFLFKCSKSPDDIEQVNKQYDDYILELEKLQNELQECNKNIALLAAKRSKINSFIYGLEAQKHMLTDFDPEVWQLAINRMVIYPDLTVKFIWRDGSETSTIIERGVKEIKKGAKRKKVEPVLSDRTCMYCGEQLYDNPGYVRKIFCNTTCRRKWCKQEKVESVQEYEENQRNK